MGNVKRGRDNCFSTRARGISLRLERESATPSRLLLKIIRYRLLDPSNVTDASIFTVCIMYTLCPVDLCMCVLVQI